MEAIPKRSYGAHSHYRTACGNNHLTDYDHPVMHQRALAEHSRFKDLNYRRPEIRDISTVSTVWATAENELHRRHGISGDPLNPFPPSPLYTFSLKEQPEGFWVAEEDNRILRFTISWVRGSFWFLSALFVLPDYQSKGVGRALIEKALEYSRGQITNRAVITPAYNRVSISLYIRNGMYPRQPLYWMTGSSRGVLSVIGDVRWNDYEELEGPILSRSSGVGLLVGKAPQVLPRSPRSQMLSVPKARLTRSICLHPAGWPDRPTSSQVARFIQASVRYGS